MNRREWRWKFLLFETHDGTQSVQAWFDDLPPDVRDEIADLLRYLEKMTNALWRRPEYDPLDGEGGISEIRMRDVPVEINGQIQIITARMYGFFGPGKGEYTFLHGTNKRTRNDKRGKQIARDRLAQIKDGNGIVYEFKF